MLNSKYERIKLKWLLGQELAHSPTITSLGITRNSAGHNAVHARSYHIRHTLRIIIVLDIASTASRSAHNRNRSRLAPRILQ